MILKQEYASTEEAFKEAKHWLKNSATGHLFNKNTERAEGINEAISCIEIFLSRVKNRGNI